MRVGFIRVGMAGLNDLLKGRKKILSDVLSGRVIGTFIIVIYSSDSYLMKSWLNWLSVPVPRNLQVMVDRITSM